MQAESPLVIRLEPEVHKRLKACAARTKIKKYTLAIMAIEAAVEAIERNDYSLVVPIEFEVVRVPSEKDGAKTSYPSHREQFARVEDKPAPKKKAG